MSTTQQIETMDSNTRIDLCMSVLCACAPEGKTLTLDAIADICECSQQKISHIEQCALKKLQSRIRFYDHI